jgi:single-strand DNA-binding protein
MASYNRVILMGHLTRDPELRYSGAGTPIAKMGMAMNRKWRDKDEQLKEEVTFVDVTSFGKQAEVATKYLKKGSGVLIGGRLHYNKWQTSTGESRSRVEVISEDLQFLPRGGGHSLAAGEPRADSTSAHLDVEDDSDPFGELPNPLGLGPDRHGRRGDA